MTLLLIFLGALIPTFLVSRVLLWVSRKRPAGLPKYILVHLLAGAAAASLLAYGSADGGPLNWSLSWVYGLAQAIWFAVDLLAEKGRQADKEEPV